MSSLLNMMSSQPTQPPLSPSTHTEEDESSESVISDQESGQESDVDVEDPLSLQPLKSLLSTKEKPEEDKKEKEEEEEEEEEKKGTEKEMGKLIKEFRELYLKVNENRKNLPEVSLSGNKSDVSNVSTPRSLGQDSIITDLADILGTKKRRFDKIVYDEDREEEYDFEKTDNKGWTKHKKHRLRFCLWRLKYNRVVTQFYLSELIKSEEWWSWMIIMISTITSGVTVANNVDDEPFENYNLIIKITLNVSSMTTALIAAWIKKRKFVETINQIDKYLIGVSKLCEELEIRMALLEDDRMEYEEFITIFLPQIIHYATSNPMIPPDVWKRIVRDITLNYPELVDPDSSEVNKMWPWFGDLVEHKEGDNVHHVRKPTNFMKYMKKTNKDKILSSCCRRKKREFDNVYK